MCTLCKFSQLLWASVVISSQSRKTPVLRFDPNLEECQHPHAFSFPQKFLCDIITDYENSFFFWCIDVVYIEVKSTLLLGRRLVFVIVFLCLSSQLPDYREALFLLQVDTLLLNRLHSDTDTPIDTDTDTDKDAHFMSPFHPACYFFLFIHRVFGIYIQGVFCDWDPLRSSK